MPTPTSHLTPEEWRAVFDQFRWTNDPPIGWQDVSNTQLSIARHYGGTTVNGAAYLYIAETDELIRQDVLKWVLKRRADAVIAQCRDEDAAARAAQGSLI